MQFCPHDGTLLQVHVEDKGTPVAKLMFFCPLCVYIDRPKGRQKFQVQLQKKLLMIYQIYEENYLEYKNVLVLKFQFYGVQN